MKKDIKALRSESYKMMKKLEKSQFCENFGQKEIMQLKDKYIDPSEYSHTENEKREVITWFKIWCENYTPKY